jgi:hypothetical protein
VKSLPENENNETEADIHEISVKEKTFCNPSDALKNCPHCKFETESIEHLEKHMSTKHAICCPLCSFETNIHSE